MKTTNRPQARVLAPLSVLSAVLLALPSSADVTGQWDFSLAKGLGATIGADLEYFDGPTGATAGATVFGTTTSLGIPDIGGQVAEVMGFPATSKTMGYIARHGAMANGGGAYVNQYTLIMDVLYPSSSHGQWRSIYQTATDNSNDGDFFVRGDGGIGISGNYQGAILPDTWHRLAVSVDLTTSTMAKYIDGVQVGVQTLSSGVDGRWALYPADGSPNYFLLFADEDGETAPGYVNSIQFHNVALSATDIAALGGPQAEGIMVIPEPGTLGLIAVGLAGLALAGWRRRS